MCCSASRRIRSGPGYIPYVDPAIHPDVNPVYTPRHNSHHYLRVCDNRDSPFIMSRKSAKTLTKSLFRTDIYLKMKSSILFFAYLGVLSHLFLDWLTTYGIPIFYPFKREVYAAELFFSIDLYLMVLSASLIIYAIFMRSKAPSSLAEKKIYMDRIYLTMFILLLSMTVLLGAVRYYEKGISLETFSQYEASAYPTSSPFEWRIYDKPDGKVYAFDSIKKSIIDEYSFQGINPNSHSFLRQN